MWSGGVRDQALKEANLMETYRLGTREAVTVPCASGTESDWAEPPEVRTATLPGGAKG